MKKLFYNSILVTFCLITNCVIAQQTCSIKITTTTSPTDYHQVNLAAGFTNANAATVDLFGKGGAEVVSIPNNYVGTQEADSGDNYFGLITFYGSNTLSLKKAIETSLTDFDTDDIVNYGEFLQTNLPITLIADKEYELSFKVSLADNAGFATSGWGIYFNDKTLAEPTNMRLTQTPQIQFTETVIDKGTWTELKTKFKATGTEKNMVIGCFNTNYKSERVAGGRGFAINKAYYYLSSITITEVPTDRDKDGVLDKDDKCPDVFGLATMAGCPDADGDGITDADDKCPTVKGLSEFVGCPDTDNDGIEDAIDKCPTIAGIKANTGCPEIKVDEKATAIFEKAMSGIQFETGKDIIKKTSFPILDNVVTVLKENPTWFTTVEGHTDNLGDAEKNKTLSDKRATAVKNYLITNGVNQGMINSIGFGVEKPMADNATKEGRTKNRRVEFKVTYAQ